MALLQHVDEIVVDHQPLEPQFQFREFGEASRNIADVFLEFSLAEEG